MSEFFANNPTGKIPGVFSIEHLILAIITMVLGIILILLIKGKSKEFYRKFSFIIAVLITILESIKIAFCFINGRTGLSNWFPLAYCSLFIYAIWLAACKNEKLRKTGVIFLQTGGMMAGLSYLIYPSTSLMSWPVMHYFTVQPFIHHGLMFFVGVIYVITDPYKIKLKDLSYYMVFYGVAALIALVLDFTTESNMMFFYTPFKLPQPVVEIYNFSHFLYTVLVFCAYILIYFVGYLINVVVRRIKK